MFAVFLRQLAEQCWRAGGEMRSWGKGAGGGECWLTVTKNSRLREFDADNGCAGHLFAINLCVGVCENRTGGHCVVFTICHGWQEGRRGRLVDWQEGGRESGIFLLRFGEFVCLAICVTKKHSLLNFIRRSGRMGVAYDNTLIMHCMLLSPCVCVCVSVHMCR